MKTQLVSLIEEAAESQPKVWRYSESQFVREVRAIHLVEDDGEVPRKVADWEDQIAAKLEDESAVALFVGWPQ